MRFLGTVVVASALSVKSRTPQHDPDAETSTDIDDVASVLTRVLDILSACEGRSEAGVLSIHGGDSRMYGEAVLVHGRVCLVASEGSWARNFRRNNPQDCPVLEHILVRCLSSQEPLARVLTQSDSLILERFRDALLNESARNLVNIARATRIERPEIHHPSSKSIESPFDLMPWHGVWSPARPTYPEVMTFSAYEVYQTVVGLLPMETIGVKSVPVQTFEASTDDCRWAVLCMRNPYNDDCPLPLEVVGEQVESLSRLGRVARRVAQMDPPRTPGGEDGGLRCFAFGTSWTRCVGLSDDDYHVVLESQDPAARARIAQRVTAACTEARG